MRETVQQQLGASVPTNFGIFPSSSFLKVRPGSLGEVRNLHPPPWGSQTCTLGFLWGHPWVQEGGEWVWPATPPLTGCYTHRHSGNGPRARRALAE